MALIGPAVLELKILENGGRRRTVDGWAHTVSYRPPTLIDIVLCSFFYIRKANKLCIYLSFLTQ